MPRICSPLFFRQQISSVSLDSKVLSFADRETFYLRIHLPWQGIGSRTDVLGWRKVLFVRVD